MADGPGIHQSLLDGLRRTLAENADEAEPAAPVLGVPQVGSHQRWMKAKAGPEREAASEEGLASLHQAIALGELFERRLAGPGLLNAVRDEVRAARTALEAYRCAAQEVLARPEYDDVAGAALHRASARLAGHQAALLDLEQRELRVLTLSPAGARVHVLQSLAVMIAQWLQGLRVKAEVRTEVRRLRDEARNGRTSLRLDTHPQGRWLHEALRGALQESEDALGLLDRAIEREDLEEWAAAWQMVESAMLGLVRRSDDCRAMREEHPQFEGTVL